ncbi:MAG: Diadenosine tetraphosphatase ApaH/serine/threonine protein phosphatase, PP2A family [Chloroflexi bacterium AL-W]|nr:Diadenosine tetraphosphatase ApaH/serine/threonine protein phosphatase, PP2A family [Chloroflexi bacterium AL-N1]NOK68966.1 Diadenosine tetraphosphatase ApaH/serine/threonine protein phosphatase, PP2A family [Chloroflexi bacterium AL-N10]NOK76949.1 Diadenosine tetraphosphatase ApaH/serine/threonine protein phosphatase, PP2A family [Chloroflexi bacterium AL-N5]NOK82663.1 Diadenosine tetraphosphatase ApaH/serine/threonine protein phosphatase, PP2A family [Chloroflexi bacterium AL-W]NOK90806.1 
MRVVVFSDVHGNVVALEAVLDAIRQDAAPDALFMAGDLALLGPRPAESLALLRSLDDTRFVMGNTDKYILDRGVHTEEIDFTRSLLSIDDLNFMESLPFEQRLEVAPGHELLVVHANPRDLEEPIKPGSADAVIRPLFEGVTADVVAFGHYHVPFVRQLDGWLLVDVASVGMPRDNDQRAVYVILTWDGRVWHVEHRRVPFDMEYVARDYVAVGYPNAEEAAQRLLAARY